MKKATSEEARLYCNYQQGDGWTALMLASQNGHAQVAELLFKEYADDKNDGWTALMLVSQNGHFQVVELLLMEYADVNLKKCLFLKMATLK